ncbi:hypothetical protein RN001_003604 [Aquatica leii]|uniref:Uncharacterized protein n=1 Tax=Aquatica leii TaxID=1421715 RepID=A0AAN7PIT4_9COLE|nr:hypothetical protein RN001_003604 [Aquatica leii]
MGDYEREQARLEQMMNDLMGEEDGENVLYDDETSSDEEDLLETNGTNSDTEQEISDCEDFHKQETNELYYEGKDKVTKWGKHALPKNVRTRPENKVSRVPSSRLSTRSLQEPLEIWKNLINDTMLDLIVDSTNIFINSISGNYVRKSDVRLTN